jgi:hypothetical protein
MTFDLSLFLLPLGRPRLRFGSADLTFFASFLWTTQINIGQMAE